jgi:hypothetical protein
MADILDDGNRSRNPPLRQDELRCVLLVKAIEEADREGTLVPLADRAAATRTAARSQAPEQMGVERARILFAKIVARHPSVDVVSSLAGGPAWAGGVLMALALVLGFALSALDGTRRINVLAFPLLGLVLWNLAVYAVIFANGIRARAKNTPPRRPLPEMLAQLGKEQVSRLVAKSGAFNAPLAEALGRFTREWFDCARPLLVARATRVFHLCAAAVGIGLVAGLYLRGIAFDYQAGWESTFFDASRARTVLAVLYGPASIVTEIPIPDAAHLEAIRWKDGAGGERAASWIHLTAATAILFVVLPRLALALLATLSIARWSSRAPLPVSLTLYFRNAFGAQGDAFGRGLVTVIPYAYEPDEASRAGLRALLPAALGESITLDARAPVRFGDEEEFLRGLVDASKRDAVVLLFNLAATPEEENHGIVVTGVRDWLTRGAPHAQLMVLVDEGPYAVRMGAAGGADARVAERRRAWQEFVAAHGLEARIANLASP